MLVYWSARAQDDIVRMVTYIAEDSPNAARRVERRIYQATAHLTEYPGMGRPGRVDGTRELVIARTPYIVPYRVRGQIVEIIAVMHGAQQWPDNFD